MSFLIVRYSSRLLRRTSDRYRRPRNRPSRLRIQVLDLAGVRLDEPLSRLDLVAHEVREELVGDRRRIDSDLQERPVLRVHSRLPQLVRVHLPKALEATDAGVAVGAQARQRLLQLPVVVDVVVLALVRDLVERRLRYVHVAGLDQLLHVPVQEGQHQRTDMTPVHVGVGHDDDLVVAGLPYVEGLPHSGAYGADHGLYLDVGEDLVDVGLLDVEDLAPQGQYRLEVPLPALLRATTGRVALDDVQLAPRRVFRREIRQLARQRRALQIPLADSVSHLPRGLARPRGLQRLVDDRLRLGGTLLEELGEEAVRGALHEALDLGVPELGLGLSLELRVPHLDRDDGREPLPYVVAGEVLLLLFEEPLPARVSVYSPRERSPEAREVRPALVRVDVVGEGEDGVLEAAVPLHRDLDVPHPLVLALEVEDGLVHRVLGLVYVRHEVPDAALVLVGDLPALITLVDEPDLQPLVEESRLPETAAQGVEGELDGLSEDLRVGPVADRGSRPLASLELAGLGEISLREAALVALGPDVALAPDLHLQPLAKRVDDRGAHAVQPAGDLVALAVELAAGVQRCHDDLRRGLSVLVHLAHRHPAPIIRDGDGVVPVDSHQDLRAVPRQSLVYGVVHDLPHEVVQPARPRRAYVHTRPPLDGLEPLQNLDGACIIGALGTLGRRFSPQKGPSSSYNLL